MSVQQVVAPGNLGAEFDVGVEEANKIHVKVDGATVVRAADGTLQAVRLVQHGDGTVLVTPADGSGAWTFDPCCSRPWEKYGGKVCYELTSAPVAFGTTDANYFLSTSKNVMTAPHGFGVPRTGGSALGPAAIDVNMTVGPQVVDASGTAVRIRVAFSNVVERAQLRIGPLYVADGRFLDTFSLLPTTVAGTATYAGGVVTGTGTGSAIVTWHYPDQPFDVLEFEWTSLTNFGIDMYLSSWSFGTSYAGSLLNTAAEVRAAFVWDDNGTPRYQDVESGALVVNPTIVACV